MTKLLFLCLVLSVLLKVGHSTRTYSEGDVILKDSHRVVVVVKYDGDGKTNNIVLISPPEKEEERKRDKDLMVARDVEEKSKAREARPNKAQNVWERAKILARGVGTVVAEELKIAKIGSVVSLIGIAAAYGTCVWVTLVSSYVLASVLGVQKFSMVKSKVYLVYFKAISVGILVGLLGHVLSRRRKVFTDAVDMWQALNLMSSILMVETNGSCVEPRVTKAMFERLKLEKEEGRGRELQSGDGVTWIGNKKVIEKMDEDEVKERLTKLSERLSRFHGYSSWLNLLTLMSLTWHFVYLGHRLSLTTC